MVPTLSPSTQPLQLRSARRPKDSPQTVEYRLLKQKVCPASRACQQLLTDRSTLSLVAGGSNLLYLCIPWQAAAVEKETCLAGQCPVPGKPNHSTSSETEDTKSAMKQCCLSQRCEGISSPLHDPSSSSQLVQMGVTHCTARGYNEVSHSSFSSPFVRDNADCGRFLRRPCPAHEAPAQLLCSFPPPGGRTGRGGDNLQQRVRLEKKEVSAQSGQLSQPTAAVIPLPQVPVLFCSCSECYCMSSSLVPTVLSACSIQTWRWGKGVKRISQNCFQILLLQCVSGACTLRWTSLQKFRSPELAPSDFSRRKLRARYGSILMLKLISILTANPEALRSCQ
ncbi:uncharacterized protein LOC111933211 isoform X1 [Cyanistes caeruleus]|uniref:uncharacterized protein LOC111933211 isoform X1 n=1 Tax=Cyanistes caeruleus TaxID=156563 RepID=UPI000CDB4CE5|nr:uncharacterized protein LOC111933211 isoform X1 [Cyanistes caeruleus]